MFPRPDDKVAKLIKMPRCERDWINKHQNINFAGLIQEIVAQMIETNDPEYFEKYREVLENLPIRKLDHTKRMLEVLMNPMK